MSDTEPIDLRRLAQFVASADSASLTDAARRLFITQQAMSSAMRQLERDLGVALFSRQGRRIELTPAGRRLRAGAGALLAASASLTQATQRAAGGEPVAFVVAHTPAITADEAFALVEPIRAAYTDTPVTVRQMFLDDMLTGLLNGTVDVGLRRGVATPPDLAAAVIGYDTLRLAVDAEHPLAGSDPLPLTAVAEWTLAVWSPPTQSFYTDFLIAACRRAGFEPTIAVNAVQGTPPVTAVAGNRRVALVTAAAGPALSGRVAVLELVDPPMVPVQAIWLPHTMSAERTALLDGRRQRVDPR